MVGINVLVWVKGLIFWLVFVIFVLYVCGLLSKNIMVDEKYFEFFLLKRFSVFLKGIMKLSFLFLFF